MSVVISNGATTLATASGFYRVEAHNLGMWSTTVQLLTVARTIPVTFANAGNCQGVVLALTAASATADKSVTVTLQENVASVWTDRTSVTVTAATITNSAAVSNYATWITPFTFGTPYAVTTAASTWRFSITQGAGTYNWNLKTSDATNPFYATWCDNAVSYASGDVPIAKDKITIDMSADFTGVALTGDATRSTCAVACTSSTPTPANVAMFEWENAPAASYTLNINGYFVLGANSGFRVGTLASPIPYAEIANIIVKSASTGTSTNTGFNDGDTAAIVVGRQHLFMYGEIPTVRSTTLASDAATAQQDIVTTDVTGWSAGDTIAICKADLAGITGDTTPYSIDTIVGTAINVNTNIVSAIRKAGGHVFRLNGYGVYFKYEVNLAGNVKLYGSSSIVMSGVQLENIQLGVTNGTAFWQDDIANLSGGYQIVDSSVCNTFGQSTLFQSSSYHGTGVIQVLRTHLFRVGMVGTSYGPVGGWQVDSCISFGASYGIGGFYRNQYIYITNNYIYNANGGAIEENGIAIGDISNNTVWGCSTFMRLDSALINVTVDNNTIDKVLAVFTGLAGMIGVTASGNSIGVNSACTYIFQIYYGYSVLAQIVLIDTTIGTITDIFWPGYTIVNGVDTTGVAFQNYDLTTSDDRYYMPYGDIQRTNASLPDTTVRTAGGSAMRFTPYGATNLIHWEQTIPTGDITAKTMTITCWVKINNAAYYAGSHTKPTLTVTYDQTSTVTSVATTGTGWQQLACTFTPATSFGQVQMKITGGTDATTTNRYFYVDDFNIAYPAGVQVDLGGLDLWADGLPVAPAIATMPSITGVWDEPLTAHTVSGSYGAVFKKLLTVAKFLGLK